MKIIELDVFSVWKHRVWMDIPACNLNGAPAFYLLAAGELLTHAVLHCVGLAGSSWEDLEAERARSWGQAEGQPAVLPFVTHEGLLQCTEPDIIVPWGTSVFLESCEPPFLSFACRYSWQRDVELFALLMLCSCTLTKWSRAIPIALNLDSIASAQFTWKALVWSHTFSACFYKWFPALSIERRGRDYDPVETLERTEHNLGVQADIQDLQGYELCCSFAVLQGNGPNKDNQRWLNFSFPKTSPHTGPSCHRYFADCSQCVERPCIKATSVFFSFSTISFHWMHFFSFLKCSKTGFQDWHAWILLGSLHTSLATVCNPNYDG